ncbi:Histidine kinase [Chitinophaga eiseniae]|uniref:Histidine kinase n=1 Tax=Chitinophaga eiseniae TaxID=634771 RepID=A0A1T4N0W5_9BACT|nr:histidine kinase [Chitinophaga eiseniae]SJZ72548.1 Histidine kinase [Chitinophaga eiseniae]
MENKAKWLRSRFLQELVVFIAMFILTMLHEWIKLDTFMAFLQGLIFFILLYGQAQLHLHLIFPLLMAKKYAAYFSFFVVSTLVGALGLLALDYYWIAPELYQEPDTSFPMAIAYDFVLCIISTVTILSLFLVRQYSIELQKRSEVQLKLSEMNMKYLHAQLNPHFFFNMFNNLYGVSLTEPARTPDLILRLAELMRYQLENGSRPTVTIREELKFIDNYIAMERERIGKRCRIRCDLPEESSLAADYRIAPLILITLVENAFKHSVTITRPWFVDIRIRCEEGVLTAEVRNSLPDEALKNTSTGIGLINIRERLEMLYQHQYTLISATEDQEYRITLTLRLNAIKNG